MYKNISKMGSVSELKSRSWSQKNQKQTEPRGPYEEWSAGSNGARV